MTTRRDCLGMLGLAAGTALFGSLSAPGARAAPTIGAPPTAKWPYEKLDPAVAAERGYHGFLKGHCMYGAFEAVVGELADRKGAPYANFPFDMLQIGAAGGAGWGTLCGALNGAMLAIAQLSADPVPVVNDLFNWYQATPLPVFRPRSPRVDTVATSVSGSVLCHVSVSRWCEAAGKKAYSVDRDDRCGWLTGSVAAKTVELLNAQADGAFRPAFPFSKEVEACNSCHGKGGKAEDIRGMMECKSCHTLDAKHPKF